LESDDDLLELAAEAGFGGPGRPRPGPDFPAGMEPEIEAEPIAEDAAEEDPAAASEPGGGFAVDEFEPEGASFPGGEAPVWDIPLEESGIPEAEPEPRRTNDSGHEASGVEPLVQQSLERTVEAIVPALIRNIEALVVRQLPDLVEKIVLREIDKIKRGE
jgi:hypothetical protein